jgi:hypothetical protein
MRSLPVFGKTVSADYVSLKMSLFRHWTGQFRYHSDLVASDGPVQLRRFSAPQPPGQMDRTTLV